jgi:tRNA A37 threonylcarbamoyladenosine synthetase subunit TsaC/SUA5/YrdC
LLPTDIGYGLIACAEQAVARIYALKGRPLAKASVVVANAAIQADVAVYRDARMRDWVARVSAHSPLAVINAIRPESRLLRNAAPYVFEQATVNGTIATFHNAGLLVTRIAQLAFADGRLVVGSSANLSSTGNNYRLDDVPLSMRAGVDCFIDLGVARYENPDKLATTLLDLTTGTFRRKGVHSERIAREWESFRCELAPETSSLVAG